MTSQYISIQFWRAVYSFIMSIFTNMFGLLWAESESAGVIPRITAYCYWLLLSCCDYVVMPRYPDKRKGEQEAGWWTGNIILIICGGDGLWVGMLCICHGIMNLNTDCCSGVFLSAEWFCIRLPNGVLKILPWNLCDPISGTTFFCWYCRKNGIAFGLYGYCFHIIFSVKSDIYCFCNCKKAFCNIDNLPYTLFQSAA